MLQAFIFYRPDVGYVKVFKKLIKNIFNQGNVSFSCNSFAFLGRI